MMYIKTHSLIDLSEFLSYKRNATTLFWDDNSIIANYNVMTHAVYVSFISKFGRTMVSTLVEGEISPVSRIDLYFTTAEISVRKLTPFPKAFNDFHKRSPELINITCKVI